MKTDQLPKEHDCGGVNIYPEELKELMNTPIED